MKLKYALVLALLIGAVCSSAPAAPKQVRAIWAARWMVATPADVANLVQTAKANRFNAIIFQVRGDGMLLYPSKLETHSDVLANAPPDWDPLADVIRQAHAEGIEVHAWINSFSFWTKRAAPPADHITVQHPDWLMVHSNGKRIELGTGDGLFADPGNPEVREHLKQIFLEVASNYDVDGVHFDYIRYPARDFCYCDQCLAAMKASMARSLKPEEARLLETFPQKLAYQALFPSKWDDWRRAQVTTLVREVYRGVKAIKPKMLVSASTITWGAWTPFKDTEAYNTVLQDWHAWMREGIIDVACPMIYTSSLKTMAEHTADAVTDGGGKPVWSGIGAYINTPQRTVELVDAAYKAGAQGTVIFAYNDMTAPGATQADVLKLLREGPYAEK